MVDWFSDYLTKNRQSLDAAQIQEVLSLKCED